MRLREYGEIVRAILADRVPDLLDVKHHGGRFNEDELKRFSVNAPAARVCFVGMKPVRKDHLGRLLGPVNMAVYLVTKGPDGDGQLLDMLERVAGVINHNSWGMAGVSNAIIETIENLYSSEGQGAGIYLGAVSFEQEVAFGPNQFEQDAAEQAAVAGTTALQDGFEAWHSLETPAERELRIALNGEIVETRELGGDDE